MIYRSNVEVRQPLRFRRLLFRVEKRRACFYNGLRVLLLTKKVTGYALFDSSPAKASEKRSAPKTATVFFFLSLRRRLSVFRPKRQAGALKRANRDPFARFGKAAGVFTRRFAAVREDKREGGDPAEQRARSGKVSVSDRVHESAGVKLQRAGRGAEGRLIADAYGFPRLELIFPEQLLLPVCFCGAFFKLPHAPASQKPMIFRVSLLRAFPFARDFR
jgi:hypothetical protein